MLWVWQVRQVYGFVNRKDDGRYFMKKTAKGGKKREEEIRRRMKNSLPWSLSRWVARVLKKM